MKDGPKFQNGSKRRESNEADLLAYDDAFNQPQSFDSSVNYGTTSERYILVQFLNLI